MSLFLFVVLSLCGTFVCVSTTAPTPFSRLQGPFRVVAKTSGESEGIVVEEIVSDGNSVALLRLDSHKLHEPTESSPLMNTHESWKFNGTVSVDDIVHNKFVLDSQEHLDTGHPLYGFVYAGEIPHVFEYLEDLNGIPHEVTAKNTLCEGETRYEATTRFLEFSDNYAIDTTPLDFLQAKYNYMTVLDTKTSQLQSLPLPNNLELHYPLSCNKNPKSLYCLSFSGHRNNNSYSLDLGANLKVRQTPVELDLDMKLQEHPLAVMLVNATGKGCTVLFEMEVWKLKLKIKFCLDGIAAWQMGGTASGDIPAILVVDFGTASAESGDKIGLKADHKGFKGAYSDLIISMKSDYVQLHAGFRFDMTTVDYNIHDWHVVGNLIFETSIGLGFVKKTWNKSIKLFDTPNIHIR